MKPETRFRVGKVVPFLKTLKNTKYTAIQQQGISGDPDFVLCVRGQYVDLELKTDIGKVSPLQAYKMSLTRKAGGLTLVAFPSVWEEVKSILSKMDKGEEE